MKKLFVIYIFFTLFACENTHEITTDFNTTDFPIQVSCSWGEWSNGCAEFQDQIEDAMEIHNQMLDLEIFVKGEFEIDLDGTSTEERSLIDLSFVDGFFDENGKSQNISAQTTNYGDFIDIEFNSHFFSFSSVEDYFACTTMHELGHALGYHGHNEEDGTLMSESADCETEGWYDDFYDWFQGIYQ